MILILPAGIRMSDVAFVSGRIFETAVAALCNDDLDSGTRAQLKCMAGDALQFLGLVESGKELYVGAFRENATTTIATRSLLRGLCGPEELEEVLAGATFPAPVADFKTWSSQPYDEFVKFDGILDLDPAYLDHLVIFLWDELRFRKAQALVKL